VTDICCDWTGRRRSPAFETESFKILEGADGFEKPVTEMGFLLNIGTSKVEVFEGTWERSDRWEDSVKSLEQYLGENRGEVCI